MLAKFQARGPQSAQLEITHDEKKRQTQRLKSKLLRLLFLMTKQPLKNKFTAPKEWEDFSEVKVISMCVVSFLCSVDLKKQAVQLY